MPTRNTAKKAAKTASRAVKRPSGEKPAKVPPVASSVSPGKEAARKRARKPSGKTSPTAEPESQPVPEGVSPTRARKASFQKTAEIPRARRNAAAKASHPQIAAPQTPEPASDPTSADLVDSQLAKYRSMRDFAATAEPAGGGQAGTPKAAARTSSARTKAASGLPFVIQKHAASHLHYDFRLGWSGVLKSWAVAKGPSYVVADRRLAIQVEDHPMEYGGFEGIIPKGQYGGGTVMVWDQGTWWPQPGHENVEAGLRTGSLKFEMHGSKMRGKWTLVRMHRTKPYDGAGGRWKSNDKPQWLLIKEHDGFERAAATLPITEEAPNSALTSRTMDEIVRQSDHVWNSKETANASGTAWYRQESSRSDTPGAPSSAAKPAKVGPSAETAQAPEPAVPAKPTLSEADATASLRVAPRPRPTTAPGRRPLPAALSSVVIDILDDLPREPQPEFIQPQLAQETEGPPEGPGWLHELKLDGYRMQARKSPRGAAASTSVQMLTRSGLDWTYRVPAVADVIAQLTPEAVTLDGEVVVLAEDGTTNFADLQASFQSGAQNPLTFFAFDLLHLEGRNTRTLPLRERKALLAQILPPGGDAGNPTVRFSEHLETNGRLMFEEACRMHAEGILSKRADEPYQTGRRASWLKSKCLHEQEFVIGGFSPSAEGPDRIGSLLLGYYEATEPGSKGAGKLIYAGRTGTGFTQKQRKDLRAQLAPLEAKSPAYARVPAEARRDHPVWVRPELVAQVRFATWTAEDFVRQAAFLGLREDKRPDEVFREAPTAAPQPKSNNRKAPSTTRTSEVTPAGQANPDSLPREPSAEGGAEEPRFLQRDGRGHEPVNPHTPQKKATETRSTTLAPVRLTHPKKILDPESSLTKQQLADFYWAVALRMLPHMADRPLSLVRCPDGAGKPCFYQKHVNSMLPPGIGSVMVSDKKGAPPEPYITLNTPEALAGLAQMGVLEVHPWGSRNNNLECPDRLIFDLDPDESLPWTTVTEAAAEVRSRLKKLGLESFLKTTGGKGLHIVAPIAPAHDFATVKDFAHRFVLAMERANPRLYLTRMTKAARVGKIYLDYLRNERGATAVAPFSPRARPGVNVSVPLDWKELALPERPHFAVSDFSNWQNRLRRDPWKRMLTLQQALDPGHA